MHPDAERLVFVESALVGLRESSPFALAAARGLLGDRDLTLREARIRLTAERGVLREAVAAAPATKPAAAPADGPQPASQDFEQQHPRGEGEQGGQFVRKGEKGPRVAALHARLGELGHQAPTHDKYDAKTQASVMEFQKRYGLPQTGVVDGPTLEAMRTPPQLSQAESHAELRTAMQTAGKAVGPGDAGPNVATLQTSLAALGYQVTDPQQEYGNSTQLAVRQVQKQNGFAPTGRADEQTLALIARLAAAAAVKPSKTGAVSGTQEKQGGNLAGDQLGTWGLKNRPGVRGKKGVNPNTGTAAPPRATPRGNSNRQKAGATSTKGGKVNEASYDGNPSVPGSPSSMARYPWGGVNPAVAAKAAALLGPMKPPGLREAPDDAFEACASCVFFGGGSTGCERYGGYPVDRDDLCDSWLTLTPQKDRPTTKKDEGESEVGTAELGESRALSEVKSDAYPGLDRSPKENWVDKAGGLPRYIERIAKHVHYEGGKDIGRAIQIAVGTVKRWCAGGSASTHGASASGVSAATKAKACAAVAEWNAKRAKSKAKTAQEAELGALTFEEAAADMELVLAILEAEDQPIPPSLRYAERVLAAVEAGYDDWDQWGADGSPPPEPEEADPLVVFAQDDAFALAEASAADFSLDPFVRAVRGKHALYVAGVPVRIIESPAEALIVEAAARAFVTSMRANPKQMRERAATQLRALKGGLGKTRSKLPRADAAVHTVVSSKFAGKGAKPRTLATDVGRSTAAVEEGDSFPDSSAGDVEGSALAEGVAGYLDAKHPRLPKGRKGGGEFAKVLGKIDADARPHALGAGEHAFVARMHGDGPSGQKTPGKEAAHDALTGDQAIGGVLQSFPGLTDWSVDKHEGDWLVHVTMPDGEHHFRITDAGAVTLADADGKPKAGAAPKPEPTHGGGYELTGESEKPYHMENGQVFKGQSKKGGWFKKLDHGPMTSEKGWKGAGVHIEDLQTGESKWVPAFAMKAHHELASEPGAAKPQKPDGEALFGDLMDSVHGKAEAGGPLSSFQGKNVVVTGKIPGYTRDAVHNLIKAKGGTPHSSVSKDTHVLITGENKAETTKSKAAAAKGVHVVSWDDVHHLLEAGLSQTARRALRTRSELAESTDGAEDAALRARLQVLEGRMDGDDLRAYKAATGDPIALLGVSETTATVRRA